MSEPWNANGEQAIDGGDAFLRLGGGGALKAVVSDTDPVLVSFGVYVIQLRDCPDKSALGALYVGSSWYPASERFRQHQEGYETGSAELRGRCRRLRPELYLDLPWHWDRRTIVGLERRRALRLAEAGFHVRCDGRVHSVRADLRTPFSSEELGRVSGKFEECMRELLASALGQLTLDDVVRALRWRPGEPSVDDLVTVPNDQVGRFSYAAERAVRDLARRTVHSTLDQPNR